MTMYFYFSLRSTTFIAAHTGWIVIETVVQIFAQIHRILFGLPSLKTVSKWSEIFYCLVLIVLNSIFKFKIAI